MESHPDGFLPKQPDRVQLVDHRKQLMPLSEINEHMDKELRSIGEELAKLSNARKCALGKKFAFGTPTPPCMTRRKYHMCKKLSDQERRYRSFGSNIRMFRSTVMPRLVRANSAKLCQTRMEQKTKPERSAKQTKCTQTGQNNSVANTNQVRLIRSSQSSIEPGDRQMRISRISENSKRNPVEPVPRQTEKIVPHKKVSLKMITPNCKPPDHQLNQDSKVKNSVIRRGNKTENPDRDGNCFLERLILELDDSDTDSNCPSKTTVQVQFRNPSLLNLNAENKINDQVLKDDEFTGKEIERIKKTHNDQSDTVAVDYGTSPDTTSASHVKFSGKRLSGRLSEPTGSESIHHMGCHKGWDPSGLSQKRSKSCSPRTTKSNQSRAPCRCSTRRRGSTNWYEPIICSCDYEQEAKHLTGRDVTFLYADPQGDPNPQLDEICRELEDEESIEDITASPDSKHQAVSASQPTRKRSMSLDTLDMLNAVEQPEVLDSLSRRQLEKEIRRGKSIVKMAEKQQQTNAAIEQISPELVTSSQMDQPASTRRRTDQTNMSPASPSTVIYYPLLQPPCIPIQPVTVQPQVLTDNWTQPCLPTLPSASALVQPTTAPILSVHQLSQPPPIYGTYLAPNLSPTILQQTVFLPNSFHSLSYQPL